ncbi:MAG: tetratricopeptide repeat protein, partial [Phycisphaerales bacterium]
PESFSPKKAQAFFDRAKTVHESENYEYAMQMWLSGLRWDPSSMDGLKGFINSSEVFVATSGKKGVSKETKNAIATKGPVGKYISALLDFGLKRIDTNNAIKVTTAASALGLNEPVKTLGENALKLALNDPKAKKDMFVKLLEAFANAGSYKLAAVAGETACKLDPSDGELQQKVRNMLAQSTMTSGGYDDTESGGFRKNIRDADKQLKLEQEDSVAKTDSTKDAIVERTKKEHEERPDDIPSLEKYAKALISRGKGPDELKAMTLYNQAYKQSGSFRFRKEAGEIQMARARRSFEKIKAAAAANPGDAEAQQKLEKASKQFDKLQIDELKLQVENYPTDLSLKYKLGVILYERGEYNEAIEQFQLAQSDPKIRRSVQNLMGKSFLKLGGWEDAAITTLEQALGSQDDDDSDLGMDIRYGLMEALIAKAQKDNDMESAERADKIAAGIAIQQFSYRDVREKRELIKSLLTEMKA